MQSRSAMAKRPDGVNRLTMSVEEAGKRLGLSRGAAYEAVQRGDIPAVLIGRRLFVPMNAIDALLDRAVADWQSRQKPEARR